MPTTTVLPERLEGLMLFRVILVTIFLGSALAVDVEALSDFSNIRNAAILTLIVGTYALTIVYALLLRRDASPVELAVTQVTLDVVIVLVFVDVTGGLDSPFLFLFLLTVVNAAVVLGRRGALYTAAATGAAMAILAMQQIGLFAAEPAPGYVWKESIFRLATNASAGVVVALLAGALVERLGEATTQLAAHQSSIRELKALNENILTSLSSGLLTVDRDETIIFFNRAAERITGYDGDWLLGRRLSEALPAIAQAVAPHAANNIEDSRLEAAFARPDGSKVHLGFSVSALCNADGREVGRIVIFQDLSDIKRLEHDMRRSERMAAVGRLSAAIAHEIRNPLASISGSVEMLHAGPEASDDDRMLLSIIIREVERLDQLISEFLDYTGQRALVLKRQDPLPIIAGVLELFRNRQTEVRIDVQLVGDAGLEIDVDAEALRQVLWNLLNNAAEAVVATESPKIAITLRGNGKHVELTVEDSGPGIAPDDLDRVFQPFFTTKVTGTGLGLATIYRIVQDHGASIDVARSSPLGGASFRILFPT